MLWLYQRTMFGKVENPANQGLKDLSFREFATFAPLIALAFWIGLYPTPILRMLEPAVKRVVLRVDSAYGPAYAKAADCTTPGQVAAAPVTAPPGFAIAAPCAGGAETTAPAPVKHDGGTH
jgi:NADH-quinone oxidoreductase subunit M